MAVEEHVLKLENEQIDEAVDRTRSFLKAHGIDRRRIMRVSLALEEALMRYRDEFGPECEFAFRLSKRLGMVNVRVSVRGHSVDVLAGGDGGDYDLGSDFFSAVLGDEYGAPSYSYRDGHNIVSFGLRVSKSQPIWANPLLIATVVAVAAFFAVRQIDAAMGTAVLEGVLSPVLSTLMGVLTAITGPLLSLSLISGICALGSISALKRTGLRAMGRIMVWVIAMFLICTAICMPLFGQMNDSAAGGFNGGELFDLLLSSFPTNLFTPFVEGNALQITVESVFVAICILALGDRSERIRELVTELNSLVFKMMFVFSKTLPLLVGLSVFKALMSADVGELAAIGTLVGASYAAALAILVAMTIWIVFSLRVSPAHLLKKSWPAVFIALTTGSSTTAMSENYRVCEHQLGVQNRVVDFWLPLGQAMFAPSLIIPLVTSMFIVANNAGTPLGPSRIVILFILVFQLSIASPKVPGGIAATFAILLGQLGLPLDSVGVLMAANVFVVNFQTALGVFIRDVEICSFAQGEGALDRSVLES